MANEQTININFPFKESTKGFFLNLTTNSNTAVKSDLAHLLLTKKGDRLYMPDFGTDLITFLFDPVDSITKNDMKRAVQESIDKYIPNLQVDDIVITVVEDNENALKVRVEYTVTEDVFAQVDFVEFIVENTE
jgi:phage baseplate assembly protein W